MIKWVGGIGYYENKTKRKNGRMERESEKKELESRCNEPRAGSQPYAYKGAISTRYTCAPTYIRTHLGAAHGADSHRRIFLLLSYSYILRGPEVRAHVYRRKISPGLRPSKVRASLPPPSSLFHPSPICNANSPMRTPSPSLFPSV